MSTRQVYPLRHKWDFRTGSPQRVFRALQDTVAELGYSIQGNPVLELESSPISDIATFDAQVQGETQVSWCNWWQRCVGGVLIALAILVFVRGVMGVVMGVDLLDVLATLGVGMVFFVLGIAIFATASGSRKRVFITSMRGEAYKASADAAGRAQVTDIVADVRLIVEASMNTLAGGVIVEEKIKDSDRQILEEEFAQLQKRIEAVLPSFMM